MDYSVFVGIDLSKSWFDASVCYQNKKRASVHTRFDNTVQGFKEFTAWLHQQRGSAGQNEVFTCLEHTGVYGVELCRHLGGEAFTYTLVGGQQMAFSVGLRRNKSDHLDAQLIARYARNHHDEIKVHTLPSDTLRGLQALLSLRDKLKKSRHRYRVRLGELCQHDATSAEQVEHIHADLLQTIQDKLKRVEKQISELIKADAQLSKNFKLLCSVPGVGRVTAWYVLLRTQNFCAFKNARQFANYVGVVPCQHTSGSSKRGRAKVSHKADKTIKALLQNCVSASLNTCAEYQRFFERQLQRGKHKYSIYNMLRRKIVERMFAVIKRGTPYVDTHAYK